MLRVQWYSFAPPHWYTFPPPLTKNTSEDKQVTIGAIFMPPRINRREKWLKEKRLRDEEKNNDSE